MEASEDARHSGTALRFAWGKVWGWEARLRTRAREGWA